MRQLFLNHVAQTSPEPMIIEIEKAQGSYIWDTQGKAYLDLIAGISVSSLGHCHPAVVQAVQKQAATYMHTLVYGEHVQSPQVKLATLLAANLPSTLNSTYFVNSGSEATEGALKLAKRFTGRKKILAFRQSYHGSTQGAMSLNSEPYFTTPYQPLLPAIEFLDCNVVDQLDKIDSKTACVIMEPIRAEIGVQIPNQVYMEKVRNRCTEVGALLIFDEIQTGFGRTGKLFAFQHYGVTPDILLLAKAMGGGMPIGAFIADRDMMQVFTNNPVLGHITTFGGHPVTCAASLATLGILLSSDLIAVVNQKETLIRTLLNIPQVQAIRSKGLLMAIQIGSFEMVQKIVRRGLEQGIITDWFLFDNTSIRIAPPLTISEEEIIQGCSILRKIIEEELGEK